MILLGNVIPEKSRALLCFCTVLLWIDRQASLLYSLPSSVVRSVLLILLTSSISIMSHDRMDCTALYIKDLGGPYEQLGVRCWFRASVFTQTVLACTWGILAGFPSSQDLPKLVRQVSPPGPTSWWATSDGMSELFQNPKISVARVPVDPES